MRKKQTKIVATISDRKCEVGFIREMHDAGVDVIRLNTAHQKPKETLKVISNIRKVSDRIGVLIDTKGPEVRIANLDEDVYCQRGDNLKISGIKNDAKSTPDNIIVSYPDFQKDIPKDSVIFIDDGKLELKVRQKNKNYLLVEAINDGVIKSNKSVNVPGVHLNLSTLSKKDKEYIDLSIRHDVDFIAHSFVRNKDDVLAIRKILDKQKSRIKIIAKIENLEGVENFNEILEHADGIMIARGDLGIELAAEEIPLIQKEIIRKCIINHKPVIVATQMLQSMVNNPRPTRAEVSDVANAVIDGVDAVMLSEESASGEYPIKAVEIMARIARRVETSNEKYNTCHRPIFKHINNAANFLIKAAIEATEELDIKEIIMAADNGFIAEIIASHRGRIPVFVKCFDRTVVRQLSLVYGVKAHFAKKEDDHKKFITRLINNLVKKDKLVAKDKVIFLGSDIKNGDEANFIEICEVGKYIKKDKKNKH